jgi:hypothetical protein|tara:strand:+ start:60 stop:344 length:285 start_codon:yes stop_codon:yes gene_type:complete
MYWLDIAAIVVIIMFGLLGFSGLLNRLRGLAFGLILAIVVIAITPFVLAKYNKDYYINTEKSIIMRYINHFIPNNIMGKSHRDKVSMYNGEFRK